MRSFRRSIDIDASPARVWEVMSDVTRWHEWTPSITSVRRLDEGPFGVGSRVIIRQPKFPPAWWRVVTMEPGRSFTWVSTVPGMRVIATHAVAPTQAGTRATLAIDMDGPLGGLWGRLTRGITNRYLDLEAEGLKARSERTVD